MKQVPQPPSKLLDRDHPSLAARIYPSHPLEAKRELPARGVLACHAFTNTERFPSSWFFVPKTWNIRGMQERTMLSSFLSGQDLLHDY